MARTQVAKTKKPDPKAKKPAPATAKEAPKKVEAKKEVRVKPDAAPAKDKDSTKEPTKDDRKLKPADDVPAGSWTDGSGPPADPET